MLQCECYLTNVRTKMENQASQENETKTTSQTSTHDTKIDELKTKFLADKARFITAIVLVAVLIIVLSIKIGRAHV